MSASPARPPTSNLPSEPDFYAAARTVFNEALAEYGLASSQIEEQSVDELEESLEKADTLVKKAETLGKVTFEVPQTGSNDQSAVKQITVEATPFLFETKVNILRRILETRNNGNRNEHLPCNLGLLLRSGDIPPVVRRATLLIRPFGLQQSTELGNTPRAPSNPLAQLCSNITLCVIGFWLKLSSQTRQKLSARQKMALYDPNTLAAQSHYV